MEFNLFSERPVCFPLFTGVQNATGNYLVGGHLGGYQSINAAGTVIELHHEQTGRSKDSLFIAKEIPTNAVLRVMVSAYYKVKKKKKKKDMGNFRSNLGGKIRNFATIQGTQDMMPITGSLKRRHLAIIKYRRQYQSYR